MARLVVITHRYDSFAQWQLRLKPRTSSYLLFDVLRELAQFGHSWRVSAGTRPASADVALLHVDATIVEPEYLALRSHYARTINFGTADISKRRISSIRLLQGDHWEGPVIVKANLNYGGIVENNHNERARRKGDLLPHPQASMTETYRIGASINTVEQHVWNDPNLIVERFLPEIDEAGYVLRTWVFMGSKERCTRQVATDPIVKADKVIRHEPSQVPDAIRAERERLAFEFGKFDFVVCDGVPVLLDTNRTPGSARTLSPMMKAGARNLAAGLDELIRKN